MHFHPSFIPYLGGGSNLSLDPVPQFILASFKSHQRPSLLFIRQRLYKYAPPTQPENGRRHSRILSLILSEPAFTCIYPAGPISGGEGCPIDIDRPCRRWNQRSVSLLRLVPSNLV
jgi:hypothetical protein